MEVDQDHALSADSDSISEDSTEYIDKIVHNSQINALDGRDTKFCIIAGLASWAPTEHERRTYPLFSRLHLPVFPFRLLDPPIPSIRLSILARSSLFHIFVSSTLIVNMYSTCMRPAPVEEVAGKHEL